MSKNDNHDIEMGCDFYTFYNLCIRYKYGNEVKVYKRCLEETKQRNDWWIVEHDEDFEELEDYYRRKMEKEQFQLKSIFEDNYPTVNLCVEEVWKCIASAKEKYLRMAAEAKIVESEIQDVWKEGDYYER